MGGGDCRSLAAQELRSLVDALAALVATDRLGPVDRLGFAMDRSVAAEALAEALRVYQSMLRGAERVRMRVKVRRGEKEEEATREYVCCEVFTEGEYSYCPGVEGSGEEGRYAGRTICCIVCPEAPSREDVEKALRCIAEDSDWRLFTRMLVARAYALGGRRGRR